MTAKTTGKRRIIPLGLHTQEGKEEFQGLIKQATANALKDHEEGTEEETEFQSREEFQQQIQEEAEKNQEINPFTMAEDSFNAGKEFDLKIYKDNEFVATIRKPINEDYLAEKFGSGSFKIQYCTRNPYQIKKTITLRINAEAQERNRSEKSSTSETNTMVNTLAELQRTFQEQLSDDKRRMEQERKEEREAFERKLEKMEADRKQEQKEALEREERRRKEESQGKNTLVEALEVFAKIMPKPEAPKDTSDKFYEMMMTMQKQNAEIIEKMNNKFTEIVKETKAETKELIEKLKPKKEGLTDLEILTRLESAKREGREDTLAMMEMIDLKAKEKAEEMAGRDPEEKEKKDFLTSVMETFGPAIAQVMVAKKQQQPRQVIPVQTQPKKIMPPQKAQRVQARPVQQQPVKPQTEEQAAKKPEEISRSGANEYAQNFTVIPGNSPIIQLPANNLNQNQSSATIDDDQLQEKIGEIMAPIITAGIKEKRTADEVSNLCYHALVSEGLFTNKVFEFFPRSYLFNLKEQFSSFVTIEDNWINEFYDHLEQKFQHYTESESISRSAIN